MRGGGAEAAPRASAGYWTIFGSTGREVWRGEVEEEDDLGGELFSAGTVLGDVSTGRALSNLSTDEIVTALEELSDFTADRLIDLLREDLVRARRGP